MKIAYAVDGPTDLVISYILLLRALGYRVEHVSVSHAYLTLDWVVVMLIVDVPLDELLPFLESLL